MKKEKYEIEIVNNEFGELEIEYYIDIRKNLKNLLFWIVGLSVCIITGLTFVEIYKFYLNNPKCIENYLTTSLMFVALYVYYRIMIKGICKIFN